MHATAALIAFFKGLTLAEKLDRNMKIEAENTARKEKTEKHLLDPNAHPTSGSAAALMISYTDEDIATLQMPDFLSCFKNIPFAVLDMLTVWRQTEKRKREKEQADAAADRSKRRRENMDGVQAYVPGSVRVPDIHDIVYETDRHVPIPLGFFRAKSLRHISLHSSTLDTIKTNNLDGTTKKVILDVHKLGDTLGPDILPTLGEHEEAAEHHLRFQSSKDAAGDDGPYTTFWHDHHTFFFRQMDKVEYYEAWAPVEAKRRHDFCAEGKMLFDPAAYQFDYQQAKNTFDLRKEFEKKFEDQHSRLPESCPPQQCDRRGGGRGSQPFQAGSRRAATPSTCLGCGERGHGISDHYEGGPHASKKGLFCTFINQSPCHPRNQKPICLAFNFNRGHNCSHPPDERLHICTLCGGEHPGTLCSKST